jgi:cystathionine beta-lyase
MSHTELADHFENDVKIKIENGHDFGESGNGFIRVNIACTRNTLMQGLNRIKAAYDSKLL